MRHIWNITFYIRTRGLALGGRPDEGLKLIDQAIGMIGEGLLYPEFALLKGDPLLAVTDPAGAEPWYQRAFDVAGKQVSRMSRLRAATGLASLWQGLVARTGRDQDVAGGLRDVHRRLRTRDLVDARTILAGGTSRVV